MASRDESKLAALVALTERCRADAASIDRAEGDALAHEVGGEAAFAWWTTVLRALIAAPPEDDSVRERYGELVDRYRDEPEHLAVLRGLGDEIRRLEADGTLPSTLVARSDRRRR